MAAPDSGRHGLSRVFAMLASTAFSLLLHGSVFAAAFLWIERTPGAIPVSTQAVSIELLETQVLEAVTTAADIESAASPSSVQSTPGETVESAAARASPASELRPVEAADRVAATDDAPAEAGAIAPRGHDVLTGTLESDEAAGVETASPERSPQKPETPQLKAAKPPPPAKTAKLTGPAEPRETKSPARKKGAARSRAVKGSTATSGRVSASTGSAVNYAARVRARVAARKPAGGGRRGTVVVAFGVTRSGALSFAGITRSSGDAALDRSVLAAVRGAGPFPPPPPNAGLRFAMPFYFK